jgi:1-acyl-sn-glycerol-3-phosphate acyltransferase
LILVSWLFTIPFLVAFGLVFVVFDPALRIARVLGRRPEEVVAGLLQWSALQTVRLTGTRFAVERAAGLRARTGYIFVSNHQSMFDVALLGGTMLTSFPKYVAKKELARGLPSVSFHLREGGNAVIDRSNRQQAIPAIRELGRQAEARGVSVVIYPEGTRAREGVLKPFKLAGSLALLEAAPNLPVVPVAVDGSWKIVRHRFLPVPFGTRVRFHLGEPIPREPGEDREALLRRVEGEIRATLDRWRA